MRPRLRIAVPLTLAAALLGAAVPGACAEAAPLVRVHGLVSLPGGAPVRGARIVIAGGRDRAVVTGADGGYELTLGPGDAAALAVTPYRRVVRASHKGWRLATRDGVSALLLDVRAVVESGGATRVEVRSNDSTLAGPLAGAYAARDAAPVDVRFDLVRQLGPEDRSEPEVTVLEVVRLAQPATPTNVVSVSPPGAGTVSSEPPRPATGTVSAPAPPWSFDTLRVAPSTTDESAVAKPSPAPAAQAPEQPRERPESLRLFPSPPARGAEAPAPDTLAQRATTTPAAPEAKARKRAESRAAARAAGRERRQSTQPGENGPATPKDSVSKSGIRVTVRTDTTSVAARDTAVESGTGAVLRVAHGVALAGSPAAPSAGRPCECWVRGTVEMRSDRPLRRALQVAVWLADAPAVRDTVVLDMGAPRPFDLGRVPCGSHRLEARPLSSHLYARLEPKSDLFDCAADVARPIRVVLEPR